MLTRTVSNCVIATVLCCLLAAPAVAQEPTVADVLEGSKAATDAQPAATAKTAAPATTTAAEATPPTPPAAMRKTEKYGRDTPRSSVERFLDVVRNNDYTTAANYLDLRNLPKDMDVEQGPQYAKQLEIVLARGLWVNVDALSPDETGFSDDGLPSYRDLLGTVDLNGEGVDILLQRVPGDARDKVWKFSNTTVAEIPRLHEVYGYGRFGEMLSRHLPDYTFLGLQTWQWIMGIGLMLSSYLFGYIATWPVFFLLRRRDSGLGPLIAKLLAVPTRFLVMAVLTKYFFYVLRPSVEARALGEAKTIVTLVALWFTFRVIDVLRIHYATAMEAAGRNYVNVLLRPVATATKIVITIAALLTWVENLGFKATTLVAGLGVGGLAVALAAQKSIENLIGAVTLYLSAPVKVGDMCRFDGRQGVVEEINLRATRIRTLERTLIAVPNSIFSEMHLENVSVRDKIRYDPDLCLSHSTTAEQVRTVLQQIREELAQRPDIDQQDLYVRFDEFGERGLDFKSLIYVKTQDFQQYLAVAEELNLRIMDIVAAAGTTLAEPIPRVIENAQ